MNCFQKLLSSWRGTTSSEHKAPPVWLWIAFKNYYLRDEEQRDSEFLFRMVRCELLSKIIIFVTRNNKKLLRNCFGMVVNCFQKLLSSWRGTTSPAEDGILSVLWIAFKNYYLRDEEQRVTGLTGTPARCELLSKIIIFVTRNNSGCSDFIGLTVVNCFQKLLSSWRGTTALPEIIVGIALWIAFKNYYLRDEEQLDWLAELEADGCELLSKIIIFVTRNNFNYVPSSSEELWIAFKNYYLRDEEQPWWADSKGSTCCELLSKIIIFVTRNNHPT